MQYLYSFDDKLYHFPVRDAAGDVRTRCGLRPSAFVLVEYFTGDPKLCKCISEYEDTLEGKEGPDHAECG